MMHSYSPKTVAPCLNGRRVIIIGDSIARELYRGFVKVLDSSATAPTGAAAEAAKHNDAANLVSGVNVEFIWDPYINTTKTTALISGSSAAAAGGGGDLPALVVFSTGLWFLRQSTSGGIPAWKGAVDKIIDATAPSRRAFADEVVLLPVEETINSMLSPDRRKSLTPEGEAEMNAYLRSRIPPFTDSSITQLSVPYVFNTMTGGAYEQYAKLHTKDGLHFDNVVTKTQANLLLNLRCNDVLPKKFTFDKTCCNQYPAPNWVQAVVIIVVLIWGPLGTHYVTSSASFAQALSSSACSCKLISVVSLAYAVRTHPLASSLFPSCRRQPILLGLLSTSAVPHCAHHLRVQHYLHVLHGPDLAVPQDSEAI